MVRPLKIGIGIARRSIRTTRMVAEKRLLKSELGLRVLSSWDANPRRKNSFINTLHRLFRFADNQSVASGRNRADRVVLAIGTVGAGGSERQVVNTALALAAHGRFHPIVVCSNLGDKASVFYRNLLEEGGVELVDLKKIDVGSLSQDYAGYVNACRAELARPRLDISDDVIRLLVVLLQVQPRIVHSFLDNINIKAGVAAVLAKVPRIILSLRSVAPINFPLHTAFMRPGYQALLTRPEVKLCCNSQAGAADYRRWLGNSSLPIRIVHNGIDFRQFAARAGTNAQERAKYGIPNDALVLGSVMRLTEEKQPLLWAKVVVEISRQLPDIHFVLVGDGPLKNDVLQYVSNARIKSRVHVLGHIRDIPSVLHCLDLFLLTSRLEGLPNVLIEAQAMGIPVVTTPAGGAIETLDHGRTGLVAPDQTVIGVAQTCMQILNDSEFRGRLSKAAPEFVRDKFSIERMLNHTLELYTE
jgi:glycosyltransferase involved in cell wall biosynthesis